MASLVAGAPLVSIGPPAQLLHSPTCIEGAKMMELCIARGAKAELEDFQSSRQACKQRCGALAAHALLAYRRKRGKFPYRVIIVQAIICA